LFGSNKIIEVSKIVFFIKMENKKIKYHTDGTVPESNIKGGNIDTSNTYTFIQKSSLSWFGTGTSI